MGRESFCKNFCSEANMYNILKVTEMHDEMSLNILTRCAFTFCLFPIGKHIIYQIYGSITMIFMF